MRLLPSEQVFVLVAGEIVWTAHAGDSRAVLSRGGKAVRLTQDHKPELVAEKARVEANGGRVDFQRCWRVICPARNGRPASGLAVSRSFGDLDFKEPARSAGQPACTRMMVNALQHHDACLDAQVHRVRARRDPRASDARGQLCGHGKRWPVGCLV